VAIGDFGAVLDTEALTLGSGWVIGTQVAHVSGNVFVVTYRGDIGGVDIRYCIQTISVDFTTGAITTIANSYLPFGYLQGNQSLINISPNYFAVYYGSTDPTPNNNKLSTFYVSNDGATITPIDDLTTDNNGITGGSLCHVSGNVYASMYAAITFGRLQTYRITDVGIITALDFDEWFPTQITCGNIIHISGTVFCMAFYDATTAYPSFSTINIADDGTIGAVIDEYVWPVIIGIPKMVHITGTIYAHVRMGLAGDGFLGTLSISDAGAIGTMIDEYEFEGGNCAKPWPLYIGAGVIVIYYNDDTGGPDNDRVVSIYVADNGVITNSLTDEINWLSTGYNEPGQQIIATEDLYIAAWGAIVTFSGDTITPITTPSTTTNAATAVGSGVGTPNGTLDADGGEACDCGFEWGETTDYDETPTSTQSRETGQTFTQELTGLTPDTTYHFRAIATNSAGSGYGADATFTTDAVDPTIVVPTVTSDEPTVEQQQAVIIGTLINCGGEDCDFLFEWGRTADYGNTEDVGAATPDTYSEQISGLIPNTEYHFRAYATNSAGTGYGVDIKFITEQRPEVNFRPVYNRAYALARWEI